MLNTYRITMRNNKEHEVEEAQSPVGLWIWATKEPYPKVLNIGDLALLSSEIQSIELVSGIRGNYGGNNNSSYDFNAPIPPPPPFSFPERQL